MTTENSNESKIYFRNDDTGEERYHVNALAIDYSIKNGEIRQPDGSFWKFKNGKIIASNPPPKKDVPDAA